MSDPQLIRCPSCGATNRVPPEKIAQKLQPVCGRCKTALAIDGKPVTVTDATFAAEVERSPVPVLLDLWAPWCAPCRMVAPFVDELARGYLGRLLVAKVDTDRAPDVSMRYGIRSIPTLIVFSGGEEVERSVGFEPERVKGLVDRVIK